MDSMAMILAAGFCGVAAIYVVVQRTLKRRGAQRSGTANSTVTGDIPAVGEDKAA